MSGINTGILHNAHPLTGEQIKALENKALETGEIYAYLDENQKLCFTGSFDPTLIKDLAWNNAHCLENDEKLTKKVYEKTGLKSFSLSKILQKQTIDDAWKDIALGYATFIDGRTLTWLDLQDPDKAAVYNVNSNKITDASIGMDGFYCNDKLVSIEIQPGVTSIGESAFEYCSNLSSIIIPDSVTNIDDNAFRECWSLLNITFNGTMAQWNNIRKASNWFAGNSTAYIQCTDGQVRIEGTVDAIFRDGAKATWSNLQQNEYGAAYHFNNNAISNSRVSTLAFDACEHLIRINIPDSVVNIDSDAFVHCHNLKTVVIGNGVTSIGYGAFYACDSLTSMIIGSSVTHINDCAFEGCRNLTNIIFNGTVAQWKAIYKGAGWAIDIAGKRVQCSDGRVTI